MPDKDLVYIAAWLVAATAVVIMIIVWTSRKPAINPGAAIPAYTFPADSSYVPAGDSTADGTPVVAAPVIQPPIAPQTPSVYTPPQTPNVPQTPVYNPPAVSAEVYNPPAVSAPAVSTPAVSTPAVSTPTAPAQTAVNCDMERDAILSYYKTMNPGFSPAIVGVQKSGDGCEAGFLLSKDGRVVSSDVRKFSFGPSGVIAADPVSAPSVAMPVVLGAAATTMSAPAFPALADIGKYFMGYAGSTWDGATGVQAKGMGSLQSCQRACFSDPSCTGVIYEKDRLMCSHVSDNGFPVLTPSANRDFYRRMPTTVAGTLPATSTMLSTLTKYTPWKDMEFKSTESRSIPYLTGSADDCARDCSGEVGCTGFHWNGSACSLSYGYRGRLSTDPGLTYYNLPPVYDSLIPGDNTDYLPNYTMTSDQNILNSNSMEYTATTANECAAMCLRDPDCSGFNRSEISGACQNVSAWTSKTAYNLPGVSFYALKPPTSAPTAPTATTTGAAVNSVITNVSNFLGYAGKYLGQEILTSSNNMPGLTFDQCAAACRGGSRCSGFNYWNNPARCYLWGIMGGTPALTLDNGASFYAKIQSAVPTSTDGICGRLPTGTSKCPTGQCCSATNQCGPALGTTTTFCPQNGRGAFLGVYDGI